MTIFIMSKSEKFYFTFEIDYYLCCCYTGGFNGCLNLLLAEFSIVLNKYSRIYIAGIIIRTINYNIVPFTCLALKMKMK